MQRLEFRVVTSVLLLLTLLGFIATVLRPRIPSQAQNRLNVSNDEFLRRAASQPINWRPMAQSTFAEAARAGKPILLLIGISASGIARDIDATFFSDREVAAFLNVNYVCVRVDGIDKPEWLNAYFPMSRLKLEFLPGFQMIVLTPQGEMIDFIGRTSNQQTFTREVLLQELLTLRRSFDEIEAGATKAIGQIVQQNDSLVLAAQDGFSLPQFEAFRATLVDRIDPVHGGMPRNGLQQLFPSAWRYLLATGQASSARMALDPILRSPMTDLIDGGFFRLSTTPDYKSVEFNKIATETAEMLTLLAQLAITEQDPIYSVLYHSAYASMESRMIADGLAAAMQVEDPEKGNRSARYSYSLRRMRDVLTPGERSFASKYLGLDVLANPQMAPFLAREDTVAQPDLAAVLRRMRSENAEPRNLIGSGFLEVEATCTARLIEAARLLEPKERLKGALARSAALRQFWAGSGLLRRIGSGVATPGYLGDYLAYSDAKLQDYLASGSTVALEEGARILVEAERRFRGDRPGEYLLQAEGIAPRVPEIADTLRESCSARMARLLLSYGRLFAHTEQGSEMLRLAEEVVGHFGAVASEGGPEVGAFFLASADLMDGRYAIASGPRSVELATALARARPMRFVAPAVGKARKDLQDRAPGIYVISGAIEGPLTLEQAQQRLPSTFDVGFGQVPAPP